MNFKVESALNVRFINSRMHALLRRFSVDRAVFFGLLARAWSLCAGPVTAVLIVTQFTPETQGYYYTFSTILALQVFVELGLGTVLIQFASHEWSKLHLDESGHIVGDRDSLSRLASIANIALRWYSVAGILVAIGLGVGGYIFFSSAANYGVSWISPWFSLCFIAGIAICLVPIWSLLEGCNQIAPLYVFRFFQGLLTTISVWIAMLIGAELWTATISGLVSLFGSIVFLRRRYFIFLKTLLTPRSAGPTISWYMDMLPMQWRIALSWMSGYFIYSLFVPVLFKYQGPLVAGQFGMTWTLVSIVGAVSSSWLSPRAPGFGMLIAQRRYDELDRQLWEITRIVSGASALFALIIWIAVIGLNAMDYGVAQRFASRILPPFTTGLLLLAHIMYLAATPFSVYLRAHKKEPLMLFSVAYAAFVGASTFLLGKYVSVIAVVLGYLIANLVFMPTMVLIWYRCRKEWHA